MKRSHAHVETQSSIQGSSVTDIEPVRRARVNQVLLSLGDASTRVSARAVADVLFHEFGEIPSSNRLHGFLGRGSLSTIVDELRQFKLTLNRFAGTEPGMGCVPPSVVAAYQKMLPVFWAAAVSVARDQVRAEARASSPAQEVPSMIGGRTRLNPPRLDDDG